ncbi:unnamed protein product [Rotaria socialis]|uniref:Uncharacterized protein n=1 Tax=Rotaria socialis TaxID=392032 RepID=A0A818HE88_9BILA|nr:unnamed protein product [Rotaria socialis]
MFTNLTYLHIGLQDICRYLPSTTCYSSSIAHLNVRVRDFGDCLSLLDERLSQLLTFIVEVDYIYNTSMIINYTVQYFKSQKFYLIKKGFSLISFRQTIEYDNQIVPCLRQMSQLEKYALSLIVRCRTSFIDGTHLVNDILSKMSYLHTFIFNIITYNVRMDEELLPTPDDVKRALIQREYNVNCYTDYSAFNNGQCHIYSLPFAMDRMYTHSSKFHGDLSLTVRYLYVQDFVRPFEHDFCWRISRDFPLLNNLTIFNIAKQTKNLIHQQDEQASSIIEFSHLMTLCLYGCYINYVTQFLLDFNTHLPCLNTLYIKYEDLVIVTDNFTNNAARSNCSRLQHIIFGSMSMLWFFFNLYLFIELIYLIYLCMIRFMMMMEPTNLDKSSSQRLLTANINIDNFQNQEELVIIDEVETEIILDLSNENRALISTIKLGISTESTTWFCEDCIDMHEEEEQ